MMETFGGLLGAVLVGIGHGCRYMCATVAFLLLVRALFLRRVGDTPRRITAPLYAATSVFERPVRRMLPERIAAAPYDYAPVVAAALFLLIGLGAHEFVEILTNDLLLIHPAP